MTSDPVGDDETDDTPQPPAVPFQAQISHVTGRKAKGGERGLPSERRERMRRYLATLDLNNPADYAKLVAVTEIRNKVGVDHGAESVPTWVRPRHARLVVGAAQVWCQLMLETLGDPDAPWRAAEVTGESP